MLCVQIPHAQIQIGGEQAPEQIRDLQIPGDRFDAFELRDHRHDVIEKDKGDDDRKRDFLAKQPGRQEKARNLLYILMPIVVTILISYIELNFFK